MTMLSVWTSLVDRLTLPAAFLFVLTIVVFFHELGHFLVARWCGVYVKAFSIGFGPEIAGFYDRHGTRWKLSWIPLGGYVKFMDDENATSMPSREALAAMTPEERALSFHAKPVWKRAAVVVAGPVANFILAIVIFAAFAMIFGVRTTEARIQAIQPGSAAEAAGLQPGDLITGIDGKKVATFSDLQRAVSLSSGRELKLTITRDGKSLDMPITPRKSDVKDPIGGNSEEWRLGVQQMATPQTDNISKPGPIKALALGVEQTHYIIAGTLSYIGDVIQGRRSANQLGGPARIADISGKVAKLGFEYLVNLIGVISVSVGLLNLFPIPLLDGGHLVFYGFEALLGRPLSERTQEYGFRMGMMIVLALMIFAFYNDRTIIAGWFS